MSTKDSAMVITGNGIDLYILIVQRSSVKLEKLGLTHSGGSVTARLKKHYGIKGRHDAVIAFLDMKIAEAKAGITPGDIKQL